MRKLLFLVATATLEAASLIPYQTESNLVRLQTTDGNVLIEWLNASTFRVCRAWAPSTCRPSFNKDKIAFKATEAGPVLSLRSDYIVVDVNRNDLRLDVRKVDKTPLMSESAPIAREHGHIMLERKLAASEMIWGLGGGPAKLDRRGTVVESQVPFVLSSAGYGAFHPGRGEYRFDIGASNPDRMRITAPDAQRFEYFFYYGPRPKDVYELHMEIASLDYTEHSFGMLPSPWLPKFATPVPNSGTACDVTHALATTGVSAVLVPALSLNGFVSPRAVQLAAIAPLVYEAPAITPESSRPAAEFRKKMTAYFETYLEEARERGYPMIRPLPMQFPEDRNGGSITDEFMLGDELLVTPICDDRSEREVYLPRGVWTRFDSGEEFRGRQTIRVKDSQLPPMFARNGTILPIAEADRVVLHYYPKLGAEFFLWETDLQDNSQFHAGPALDLLRLEIESKKDRNYEWIVHHWRRPVEVKQRDTVFAEAAASAFAPRTWRFDPKNGNLHIALRSSAGADDIVNIKF